jgi:hypothetical protein
VKARAAISYAECCNTSTVATYYRGVVLLSIISFTPKSHKEAVFFPRMFVSFWCLIKILWATGTFLLSHALKINALKSEPLMTDTITTMAAQACLPD